MFRLLLAASLALATLGHAPTAQAQASTRSYAPEDLRQLSVNDRIRVLETEYREQSNGRRLPTDQRDFYLAQINSGWSFSRIKADMAQSLGHSGNYPGSGQDIGQVVRCESIDERYRECRTPFRNRAVLHRKLSKGECIEGRSWGQRQGMVWVNWGCRADFAESRSGWQGGGGNEYLVTCSSVSDRYQTCAWNGRYGRPELVKNISKTRCVEGRNWGYRGSSIWVDEGCRGQFAPRR
jgi:hypothetical protein